MAVVEIQLSSSAELPTPLLISFSLCTTMLVAVHMLALLISTCILPNMEAISSLHNLRLSYILFFLEIFSEIWMKIMFGSTRQFG